MIFPPVKSSLLLASWRKLQNEARNIFCRSICVNGTTFLPPTPSSIRGIRVLLPIFSLSNCKFRLWKLSVHADFRVTS